VSHPLWRLRASCGYYLARSLFRWQWLLRQPRAWRWMEGQFARMAHLGDAAAQDFYGHVLLFRGQGLGAREEGLRLLRQAAAQGQSKAAFQLGVQALKGSARTPPDAAEALRWWQQAAEGGHPLAAHRLAELLREGAPGVPADPQRAERLAQRARQLGM
jgi:TPR repeat protein